MRAATASQTDRPTPAREQLQAYREEIREMVNRKDDLEISYTTFKRFAREEGLSRAERRQMIRIELPPGRETQIDYGRAGTLGDRLTGRTRVVSGVCAQLSHSRLPFIQFVFTQNQVSFVTSVVLMFEYYGGATEFISIDNLEAGVIKPDLWDPQINRALAEAAAHYGTFIDRCRVGRATDKGKVERIAPMMGQLFRVLKELHPGAGVFFGDGPFGYIA